MERLPGVDGLLLGDLQVSLPRLPSASRLGNRVKPFHPLSRSGAPDAAPGPNVAIPGASGPLERTTSHPFDQSHYGLVEAARGDESGVAPAGFWLRISGVPTSAPHRGYRVTPVRRWGLARRLCMVPPWVPAHIGVRYEEEECDLPGGLYSFQSSMMVATGATNHENGTLPVVCGLYMSGVPTSWPHRWYRPRIGYGVTLLPR